MDFDIGHLDFVSGGAAAIAASKSVDDRPPILSPMHDVPEDSQSPLPRARSTPNNRMKDLINVGGECDDDSLQQPSSEDGPPQLERMVELQDSETAAIPVLPEVSWIRFLFPFFHY